MTTVHLNLSDLITRLDADLPEASPLHKISEAQLRSHTLAALGDQLVGHYVAQAKQDGASWTEIGDAIGVSKQAAQQRHSGGIFERFTDRARHAVVLSQEAARAHRHDYIGTEHLLLGLLDETDGVAARIMTAHAGSTDAVRVAVEQRLAPAGDKTPRGHIAFTPEAKKSLEEAFQEAQGLGHGFVGTEHVLLGLIAVPDGIATAALHDLGFEQEALRTEVAAKVTEILAQRKASTP